MNNCDEVRARRLDVALDVESLAHEEAVTKQARKGYALLVLGIDRTTAVRGGFHEEIARMAAGFERPIAMAVVRGSHLRQLPKLRLNVQAPVRGNKVLHRGAEVALALARAGTSPVTALYVMGPAGLGAAQRRLKRPTTSRRHEKSSLRISSSWQTAMTRRSERPCVAISHPRMPSCDNHASGNMILS